MTAAEVLLFLIILGIVFVIVYYFLRGSSGRVELTRPIESRIDEYLDQRFETLMAEWRLVSRSRVRRFESENTPQLQEDESRVAELKAFESQMKATLDSLEERLDVLEKEMAKPGKGKSKK
ncbi:MAG: hypothetical protein HXS41_04505 [Theionarchaea archaeon]|nr:hypothetical protein [Theionarchaea archaeon]MBU6999538.1 hypothetical protein [Theionarchaea archaeon]MBU7020298.1 hypothetical protein [Theionarchaea archaeon]MBU7035157.1 hypothetical protein [Theionarchaea archaeon]MBU7041389.1 hypothetical protein [Theionarchaea archaeon]